MSERDIVAIDGPSGAGKSTIARKIADKLGYLYIDTGAMYRAAAIQATRLGLEPSNDAGIRKMCTKLSIRLERREGKPVTLLGDEDVSKLIRTPEISMAASAFSAHPSVREALTRLQREMGARGSVVMEGRDIGTVVFPEARHKIFLTATDEVRAKRRFKELQAKGDPSTFEEVLVDIRTRDADDSSREHAPLARADDAVEVETSDLNIDEVVTACLEVIQK